MFSRGEQEEIRQLLYDEMAELQEMQGYAGTAGSYHYICRLWGVPVLTCEPHGTVLRHF